MAFKHKFTYEEKVKIVSEYIDGTYGFREICKRYDINQGSLKDWKRLYETFGWGGLKTGSKTTRYSKETKEAAVRDYDMLPSKSERWRNNIHPIIKNQSTGDD